MSLSHPLLARRPARPTPEQMLLPEQEDLRLAQGRVHEATGPARRTFAMWLAAQMRGPIMWIAQPWQPDRLNGDSLQDFVDPGRLVFVSPKRAEDVLWTMEEVLRSGVVSLAIADIPALPGLTQVRRMHLAAETGAQNNQTVPIGLLLTPGQGGAPGVETRWHLSPRHKGGRRFWMLDRLRARTAPHKSWDIHQPDPAKPPKIKTA